MSVNTTSVMPQVAPVKKVSIKKDEILYTMAKADKHNYNIIQCQWAIQYNMQCNARYLTSMVHNTSSDTVFLAIRAVRAAMQI